jgi:hypothetical protein
MNSASRSSAPAAEVPSDGRGWPQGRGRRYYRRRDRDGDQLPKGALVGIAVVGVAVAVANSDDD